MKIDRKNVEKSALLNKLKTLIFDSERIVLIGHTNPDGDSIGSLVGTGCYLKEMGKQVAEIVPNRYPDFLSFLDPERTILLYSENRSSVEEELKRADLIICLDFNSLKRIDLLGEAVGRSGAVKVLIDHHPQPDDIFSVLFSDTSVSSTCELAYRIFRDLCPEHPVSLRSGIAFYTGMMTDTNNFANSVEAFTFRMASELLELGVDKERLQQLVFGGFSASRMRLMGYMLYENMKLYPDLKAGVMVLTEEAKKRFGFTDGDSEGFVNLPLNIREMEVSVLFTEAEGFVRVSLRSKYDFSVNRLARRYFNGGGHERAAGGRLYLPIQDAEAYFLRSMREFIREEKGHAF